MSGPHLLWALAPLAAALAGFTQGLAGFGSTLVALPLLGLGLEAREAVPLGCVLALGLNLAQIARLRRDVRWPELGLLLGCTLPGMALGAWMLGWAPDAGLKALLGLATLVFALRLGSPAAPGQAPGRAGALAAGLAAGWLGTLIGVNGPPVVAWAARQGWGAAAFKATLAGYFLAAGLGVVAVQASHALLGARVWTLAGLGLPALLAGLWAGGACAGRLSPERFLGAVRLLLGISGAALLVQALN
jgi:uncharacterized protein